jgi:divalent metal cation (Fe/Co/Zn/Cd) transporter
MEAGSPVALPLTARPVSNRPALVRRARLLAKLGLAWHGIEAAVAIIAGVVAGSVALVGFGADSLVEATAGFVVLWRFAGSRASSASAERRAQKLIGLSFYLIAAYVAAEAVRSLTGGEHPDVSVVGIVLAAVTLATMPPLAIAKSRVGDKLASSATKSEGRQNMLCAYLSAGLLVGLGREAWRGEDSCCAVPASVCDDDCCS